MKADLVSVIEAAYLVEQSEVAWLKGVLRAARTTLDAGLGIVAFSYNASNPAAFRLNTFVCEGLSEEAAVLVARGISLSDADHVRRSFLLLSCGTSSEVPGWHDQRLVDKVGQDFGIRDTLTINGMNPNGQGCAIAALLPKEMSLSARRRNLLAKISCHLAAAHRLREGLSKTQACASVPEAILDYDGKIRHAEGQARSKTALSCLKQSTLAIVNSRGNLRTLAPEQAVDEWKGLIAARGTLLDVCETDGRKYLIARQNKPRIQGPNGLTEREQEVLAFAAMGHHNKLIAYNLGISHSTVRVLIARAAGKLGVRSRNGLIRRLAEVAPASTTESQRSAR